jgi:hypothetical protein
MNPLFMKKKVKKKTALFWDSCNVVLVLDARQLDHLNIEQLTGSNIAR